METFGGNQKRQYFCNPKRRGSEEASKRNEEMGSGEVSREGGEIFENNGTKVADGLEMLEDIEEPTGVR